jgi:hypothetical protein
MEMSSSVLPDPVTRSNLVSTTTIRLSCYVCAREVLEEEVNMKTTDEILEEIENANNGDGPDPVATVDDPDLARIAVAQIRLRAAERELDEAVMVARDVGLSWQAIGDVLGMTRQGANKRFHAA